MNASTQLVKLSPMRPDSFDTRSGVASPFEGNIAVSVSDCFGTVHQDWLRLQEEPSNSLHQSLEWCSAWHRTHRNPVVLVTGAQHGRTEFILPLEIVKTRFGRLARFIAAPYSNVNTGLFSRKFQQNANASIMADVSSQIACHLQGKADLVVLSNVPPSWRGTTSPFVFLPSVANQNQSFQLPLLKTFEETLGQINAKRRRKKYRTSLKRLEALGGYEHIIANTVDQRRLLMDLYFEQKSIRFKNQGLPDVFKPMETKAFFHELTRTEASGSDFALQLHALQIKGSAGQIAAIAGLSRKGDHVICQFSSIDEKVAADASPGEFLFHLMVEHCNRQGVALFDFGIGEQSYKSSWCPVKTIQRDYLIPLSLTGHIAARYLACITFAKSSIKASPRFYAFIQRLRSKQSLGQAQTPGPDID
jgi:CelD/BcsL family acetyltransferase involved in cellulose biosynthesis